MSRIEKALDKNKQELEKKREYESNSAIAGSTNSDNSVSQNSTKDESLHNPSTKKDRKNKSDSKLSKRERNITYAVEKKEKKISQRL